MNEKCKRWDAEEWMMKVVVEKFLILMRDEDVTLLIKDYTILNHFMVNNK